MAAPTASQDGSFDMSKLSEQATPYRPLPLDTHAHHEGFVNREASKDSPSSAFGSPSQPAFTRLDMVVFDEEI